MPTSPTPADLRWLRSTAADLADAHDRRDTVDVAMTLLADRVGSTVSTYSELAVGRPTAQRSAAAPVPAEVITGIAYRIEEHPLFGPVVGASLDVPTAPVRISDVLSLRRWRDHPIYRELLAPHGLPLHSVCLPVTANRDGRFEWFQFNRDADFDDRETELLARLQPALIALRRRAAPRPVPTLLTTRELAVLREIATGSTVAATARRLCMAPGTARKHLEHIHAKLGTSGPVATVARAARLGLLD